MKKIKKLSNKEIVRRVSSIENIPKPIMVYMRYQLELYKKGFQGSEGTLESIIGKISSVA